MATASETKPRKTSKPFEGLRCPKCGDEDALTVGVVDLALTCQGCGEDLTRKEIDALMERWTKLFAWIDQAREM